MRVLITGATGFVGRWAVAGCLDRGHDVGTLVLPADPATLPAEVQVFRGSLERPPWDTIDSFAPEACIHTAWVTTPGEYMTSPLNESFATWSESLFSHLFERSLRRVVGVGSCIEYLSEDSEQAQAPYVQYKKRLRAFLEREAAGHGLEWTWARVFFPFGEGEPLGKLSRSIVETLLRGEPFSIRCPNAVRDYIAVQDAGWGLAMLVDSTVTGDIDIGLERAVTVKEVALSIAEVLGVDPETGFEWGNEPDSLQLPLADPARMREAGWTPKISMHEGMRRLVQSLGEDTDHG